MKNTTLILMFSFFTTFLLGVSAYLALGKDRKRGFNHLMEMSGGLLLQTVIYYFALSDFRFLGLIMVGWLWPLRGMGLLLQDVNESVWLRRWQISVLAAAAVVSVNLAILKYDFFIYTAPFAWTFSFMGLRMMVSAYKEKTNNSFSPLQKSFFVFSGLYFISSFVFPLLGTTFSYVLTNVLLITGLGFAAWAMVMEFWKKHLVEQMASIEKARSDKLVGNSKYSELGMMAAGIAHEINNPLAVIQARTTQLLRIYRDTNKQQELADGLQQILYTSERINRTIQGVREFVHDERSRTSEIKLTELIDDVLAFCAQRMKNHGVNLRFYGIEGIMVWGNKIQLEQIILNLLNNSFDAIEFLPDKWIEVSAQQDNDRVHIFVKDSGHGIPADVASHIMEPFYSTKDIGKGTGLGLALARGIAEKHGGELKYMDGTSHTTFLLDLPKQPREDWGLPLVQ